MYAVGPAIAWTPFFLLGEGIARAEEMIAGMHPDLSGYGRAHLNAVALGSLLYGFGALLLVHALLRGYFSDGVAVGAVLLVWGGSSLHWYLVVQPTYAHGASTLFAAYALWLWDRDRSTGHGPWASFYLGVILGIGMCVRWQNAVFLLLPAISFATIEALLPGDPSVVSPFPRPFWSSASLSVSFPRWPRGRRSTTIGFSLVRRWDASMFGWTIPGSWRPCSRLAMDCFPGPRDFGPASWGSSPWHGGGLPWPRRSRRPS